MESTAHTAPDVARGILREAREHTIVLALPGTDYRLHLAVDRAPGVQPGKPLSGRITARARRVDVVPAGGRFIEPVFGRPRRLQGRVVATDPAANSLTVNAGCPFVCHLTANQKAADFTVGQLVAFDIEPGARMVDF